MKTFSQSVHLLLKNIRSIIAFELAYRLICIAILLPILTGAFHLSLFLAGYRYLSEDRLLSYLLTPSTIFILLFLVLSISVITVFEIFCILPAFHAAHNNKKISLTEMFQHGFFALRKGFYKSNKTLFLFTIALIPITNVTIISGYVTSITVPDFILYFIRSQKWIFRGLILLFVILSLIAIRLSFSLNCFCLEIGSYKESREKAKKLIKGAYLKTIFSLLFAYILILIFFFVIALLSVVVSSIVLRIFMPSSFNVSTLLLIFKAILTFLFDFYVFINVPITFGVISALYYAQKQKAGQFISDFLPEGSSPLSFWGKRIALGMVLLSALINLFYLKIATSTDVFWNQDIIDDTSITAHRGDCSSAPENSMAAFDNALLNHADVIELDVQQTKDDVVVVVHDFNLRRLTGKSVNVWDLNYSELLNYDIGSSYQKGYEPTQIPTLQEVLEAYEGKTDLNIELKHSAHSNHLEEAVVGLVEEFDFTHNCVIASKNLDSLKKVKELNEDIKTLYLLPIAYGNYREMTYVDGFSVKSSFITKKLVNHIHNSGKFVYAWTVNSESEMQRMYHFGVDSLITDNPLKASEVLYEQSINPAIATWLKQLTHSYRL